MDITVMRAAGKSLKYRVWCSLRLGEVGGEKEMEKVAQKNEVSWEVLVVPYMRSNQRWNKKESLDSDYLTTRGISHLCVVFVKRCEATFRIKEISGKVHTQLLAFSRPSLW